MKLSEILKENCYTAEMSKELHSKDTCPRCKSNTALTSCDREIDREALVEALWDILVTDEFLVDIDFMEEEEKLRAIRGKKNVLRRHADHIISTMPTWLKRIEDK